MLLFISFLFLRCFSFLLVSFCSRVLIHHITFFGTSFFPAWFLSLPFSFLPSPAIHHILFILHFFSPVLISTTVQTFPLLVLASIIFPLFVQTLSRLFFLNLCIRFLWSRSFRILYKLPHIHPCFFFSYFLSYPNIIPFYIIFLSSFSHGYILLLSLISYLNFPLFLSLVPYIYFFLSHISHYRFSWWFPPRCFLYLCFVILFFRLLRISFQATLYSPLFSLHFLIPCSG